MSNFLVKSTLWVTLSEIIFNLSGFVIHSVVGRILGPADYGRFGLVVTLTTMVIILIGNGIPTAMAKYISEVFDTNSALVKIIKRQAIILQSFIVGATTVIFFLSAPILSKILGDPTLTPLFQISSLIIPAFAAASFYFSYYTGLHRFNIQSFLKVSRSFFRIVFIITLAYFFRVKGSVIGYIIAPALVFFLAFLIDKFKVSKEIRLNPREINSNQRDNFDWRVLANYAWQIVIFFLAYELLISIDLYLVKGILRDDYLAGIYNGALTVGRIPYYIFYALTVVLLPVISKSTSQNNRDKTVGIISQTLRLMLIFLVPSVILMSVFSQSIIRVFYSSRYIDAAYPMSILVWGVGFLTIFYVLCFVMSGAGKIKKPMFISIAGLILNTLLNYFMIKKYGITGSAIATSIASAAITLIMLREIKKDFNVMISFKTLLKTLFAGAVIFIIARMLPGDGNIFIFWTIPLFALYLLILYAMAEIKKEDIFFLKNSLKRQPK